MSEVVHFTRQGPVGIITVDYPPVNALGPGVREGILEAVDRGVADAEVHAMVLIGAGRTFIAGADIRGFGKGRPAPVRRTHDVLEASPKPIVAAIHGYALGGGLENALGCHYRIAVPGAKVGLPEVLIGILPGGGGTQRLPRLIGPEAALEMIVTGRHVPAPEALELGILDELVEGGELRDAAVAYAMRAMREPVLPRASEREVPEHDPGIFEAMRQKIARRARNQKAPWHCIRCVEIACSTPFEEGIRQERALFEELENSDEAKALRYAFFAEREAQRSPHVPRGTPARPVAAAAVVGAGTMGGGIAMTCADAGLPVKIMDRDPETLARGMERIGKTYAASVARGSLDEAAVAARLALIEPVESYGAIADADVAIEAVFEETGVKREVFEALDRTMKPGALLLSNTSALDIDEIAAATTRPEDVAGAHFFSPANVMKLLEIVRGERTSEEALASVQALAKQLGKVGVVCGNCDGFVANRSRAPFNTEMVILLEEGALPEQVDRAMVEFGYPMGPFAVGDLAGLDIGYAGRKRREAADSAARPLPVADALVEMGRLGMKTGAGWYRYEAGSRTPHPDPEVAALIRRIAGDSGVEQREFDDEEIVRRLLFSSVNEACRIIEEGIAGRAVEADTMWLYGFGFPRYRGGLLYWADTVGVREVYERVRAWHQRYGERWAPAPLLRRLAETGTPLKEAASGM
ncbi:MAG: fatty-acid oxidation protein subunit alpha [Alphaproteobacteria bacterium]|nr:fatty-acid oxidation protein subunit alpha [Alphaproteobacteria bacterium]